MRKARRAQERLEREAGRQAARNAFQEALAVRRAQEHAEQAECNEDALAMVYVGADVVLAWAGASEYERSTVETLVRECKAGERCGVTEREWEALSAAYLAAMLPESKYAGHAGQRVRGLVLRYEGGPVIGELSEYGPSLLAKFRCQETGAVYVWKTSTYCMRETFPRSDRYRPCVGPREAPLMPGSIVALTGTIKGHSEYRGVKQTLLTRCKVTETKL